LPPADTGTDTSDVAPGGASAHQFRPERKEAALRGFGRVEETAFFFEEMALRVAGFAKPKEVPGSVNVLRLKITTGQVQKSRGPAQIVLSEVHVPLDPATVGASRLAVEAHVDRSSGNTPVRCFLAATAGAAAVFALEAGAVAGHQAAALAANRRILHHRTVGQRLLGLRLPNGFVFPVFLIVFKNIMALFGKNAHCDCA
jgi:hypothetical protein